MQVTAAIVAARGAPFVLERLELGEPRDDEVLVRIVATGLCQTDLHARDGYFAAQPYPAVFGHEGAGIIERVGDMVADLAPGDHVVISFPWCGACEPCRADQPDRPHRPLSTRRPEARAACFCWKSAGMSRLPAR